VFGSCFLLAMQEDSIEGIYDTLKQCALISKNAGGVGLHVHCIRASGSFIAGVSMPCTTFLFCFLLLLQLFTYTVAWIRALTGHTSFLVQNCK